MKKLIIFIGIIFFLTGCSTDSKLEKIIRENNYGYGWGPTNQEGLKCEEIKDAVSYQGDYFVTSHGDIYLFNSSKLFSNHKNCIKTEYNSGASSFSYANIIYNKDKEPVYITDYDNEQLTFLTPNEYKEKTGYDYSFNKTITSLNFDFISYNDSYSNEIIIVQNHKIFYVDDNNKHFLLGTIPEDEKILYMSGALIKTDKAYYTLVQTNLEECNTYVDIKCKTGFVKSSLSEVYDNLIFVGQDILVDKDYHSYGKGISFSINP